MTSRSYDGVGYYAPSFASDTPIYDSLVAERGVPQIAPINVPAALPPAYDSYSSSSYGSSYPAPSYGSGLPALPAPRLALGPGPSSPSYGAPQATPAQYPAPQPYIPQQPGPAQPRFAQPPQAHGYGTPPGGTAMPQRPVAPVAPVAPQRPAGYAPPQQPGYQGGYQSGGYGQGYQGGY